MLDDAADVIQRRIRQARITFTSKQWLAVFPQTLVGVHARAVIAIHGLGHKGRGLAIPVRYVLYHILIKLHAISAVDQSVILDAELVLRAGDFVMVLLHLYAHTGQGTEHLAP